MLIKALMVLSAAKSTRVAIFPMHLIAFLAMTSSISLPYS